MTNTVAPTRVLQLGGGIGMIIASFLQWAATTVSAIDDDGVIENATASFNGWDLGMLGLWQTLFGAVIAIAALVGLTNPDRLPKEIFGFGFDHALILLAFPVLLWNFGLQFDNLYGGVGLLIGWIAAAITIAGSELQRTAFAAA